MKTIPPWLPYALAAALLAGAVAVPAMAQPDGAQPDGAPAAKASGGEAPRQRLAELRRRLLRERVGLTDEQIGRVETITREHGAERRRIRGQMREARRDLRRLFREDSDDQEAWREALDAMENARRAQQELREAQYEELGSFLSPKQQATLLRTLHEVKREIGKRRGKGRGRGRGRGPGRDQRRGPPR